MRRLAVAAAPPLRQVVGLTAGEAGRLGGAAVADVMGVLEQRAGGSAAVQDALAAAAAHAVFFEQLRSSLGQAQSKRKKNLLL